MSLLTEEKRKLYFERIERARAHLYIRCRSKMRRITNSGVRKFEMRPWNDAKCGQNAFVLYNFIMYR